VKVVAYEEFFGGSRQSHQALLDFLEVDQSEAFGRHAEAAYRKYAQFIQAKPPVVLDGQTEHLAATADLETYHALLALSARRV
jgi:hypothetical protein